MRRARRSDGGDLLLVLVLAIMLLKKDTAPGGLLGPPEFSWQERKIVDLVKPWVGSNLRVRGDELRAFISRGIDDPESELDAHISTCGLFALAVWHAAGVKHELIARPYQMGQAIIWLAQIAKDLGAIRYPKRDGAPRPGALLHYKTATHNDDHMAVPRAEGKQWLADHAGGGRPDAGVGEGGSDLLWSSGRPLQEYYDPNALLVL
jgi:hypothetical protein